MSEQKLPKLTRKGEKKNRTEYPRIMQQKSVTYAQLENSNGKRENTEEIF